MKGKIWTFLGTCYCAFAIGMASFGTMSVVDKMNAKEKPASVPATQTIIWQQDIPIPNPPDLPVEVTMKPNCLIFWTASWCNACQKMHPVIEQLEAEGFEIYVLDYDANKSYGEKLGVKSLPTSIIMEDSKEVKRYVGVVAASEIKKTLKMNVPDYEIW